MNNIEKEQTAIELDELEQANIDLGTSPDKNKFNGMTIEEYLRDLERQFRVNEEISDEKLRIIKQNLELIQNHQLPSTEASTTLIEVFKNMEAWQKNMESLSNTSGEAQKEVSYRYYGSKKVFMENCHALYPGSQASLNLIPSEMIVMQRELATVSLPETSARAANLSNLEILGQYIERNLESNPVEEIQKLEEVMKAVSEGVQLDLKKDLTKEDKQQLSTCVQILYKLQTLIDKIKMTENYKKQKDAQKSEDEAKDTRTPEEIAADKFTERTII